MLARIFFSSALSLPSSQPGHKVVVCVVTVLYVCNPDDLYPITHILTLVYEWRHDEVSQWLRQLSPSLFKLYKSNFASHDIIGKSDPEE